MDRAAYVSALIEEQDARHAPSKRKVNVELPEKPSLVMVDDVDRLVLESMRISSVEYVIGKRTLLAGGETEKNRQQYNDAVSRVQASLEGSSMSTRLMRDAAASIKENDGEDPREVAEGLSLIEKDLKMTTNATKRAELIRNAVDHKRRKDEADRQAEKAKSRPITDYHLDARSEEILKNLREVVKRKKLSISKIDDDDERERGYGEDTSESDGEQSASVYGYHDGADPLRWYD